MTGATTEGTTARITGRIVATAGPEHVPCPLSRGRTWLPKETGQRTEQLRDAGLAAGVALQPPRNLALGLRFMRRG